jgi:SP family sugar:H+ symporter-like MFS transporter
VVRNHVCLHVSEKGLVLRDQSLILRSFVTYFYSISGITNSFTSTMITDGCQLLGSFIMFPLLRYVGRRTIMLWGCAMQTISMLALAIVGTAAPGSAAAGKCLVAFSCIYAFAFAFSWGPVAWALTTELSSNTLRSKTQSVASMVSWGLNMVITSFLPYLINVDEANIGSKVSYLKKVHLRIS